MGVNKLIVNSELTDIDTIDYFDEKTLDPVIFGLLESKTGNFWFSLRRLMRQIWYALLPRSYVCEFTRAGVHFRSSTNHHAMRRLAKYGAWEREQVYFLFGTAQKRNATVFLDIGANVGYYSLLAAKSNLFTEIYALEPHPQNYQRLLWHITKNKMQDIITPHNVASGDIDSKMYMQKTASERSQVCADNADSSVAVQCAKLDTLFDFRDKNIVIKMDVEGHELAALQGATKLFAQNKVLLQVEIWSSNLVVVKNWLTNNNFLFIGYTDVDFWFINDLKKKSH